MSKLMQLGAQDAQFLYIEDGSNRSNVTMIWLYDASTAPDNKAPTYEDVLEHIRERLHLNPLFKRKLFSVPMELDYPYWVDDEYFDLEYHVRQTRLPAPGNWRQLCDCVARQQSRPLDMERPLWDMLVIEGVNGIEGIPKGGFAIATKIHHCAVDGVAMTRFFGSMGDIDKSGTPALPLDTPPPPPAPTPSSVQIAERAARSSASSPKRLFDAIAKATPNIAKSASKALREKGLRGSLEADHPVPKTRFNVDLSPRRNFDAINFPLDDLKHIRALVAGCTINDVVMAISAGAVRRYLEHHRELPEESLVAWVPINARPSEGMSAGSADGNNVSAMTAPLFTHIDNSIARLKEISVVTRAGKNEEAGLAPRLMTAITQEIPASSQVIASKLLIKSGAAAGMCNLFISNVPGPAQPLYLKGAKVVGSYGMAPLSDGMGLFIATPSYNGTLSFCVQSTVEVMPDIEFFIDCIRASKDELLAHVAAAKDAKKTSRPKTTNTAKAKA